MIGTGSGVIDCSVKASPIALDPSPRIDPAQVLHREVARLLVRDELVELDEVRMAQRRDRAKLALEPQRGVVMHDAAELDRDIHIATQIAPEVDHAHAAAAELADDVVTIAYEPTLPLGRNHARQSYHGAWCHVT